MNLALALLSLFAAVEPSLAASREENSEQVLSISRTGAAIVLHGSVSSTAHEIILRQTAQRHFANLDAEFNLRWQAQMPPGWALVTELTLRAVAATEFSVASIAKDRIFIKGVTADAEAWATAVGRLESFLPPNMSLDHDIIEIEKSDSLVATCQRQFAQVLVATKVEFAESDSELKNSAYHSLDAIVELAADCPAARLAIIGHTDGTGAATSNIALSQARAEAVKDYIEAQGIAAERITARGAGSSEPLTTDSSARARQRNRRIEFDIVFDP